MRRKLVPLLLLGSTFGCPTDDGGRVTTFTTTETSGDGDGDGDTTESSSNTGDGDGDGDGDGTGDGDGSGGVCGDGMVDAGEECDDGNMVNTDACTNACLNATCGDGYVQDGAEECDDGNPVDTDACTSNCLNAICGDGIVQDGVEACDDGNLDDSDGCLSDCTIASCGDGVVQAMEECDDGNMIISDACLDDCTAASCGDGVIWAGMEDCDDGVESAQCDADCTLASCGDTVVNMLAGEACDDGNMSNNDACTNACENAVCGDGYVQMGESCDGMDLDGETCMTQGFNGGNLACTMNCTFNTSGCSNNPCPNGGAFVSNRCWYASSICESTPAKCQSVGLTGVDGYIAVAWDMQVMSAVAMQLGLNAGGDAGCCVEFGWIQNGSIYTHNFGPQFYNWNGCYSNYPTLKACNVP